MSRNHRLATQDVITPRDLEAENLALIVSEHPLYSDIESIFRTSGCAMNVKFQSDLFVPQFSMLEERDLIGIIDPINMRNYEIYSNDAGKLVFRKFEPEVCLRLSVISPSLRPLSGLENEFKTVLINELLKIRDVR
jgi:hypothetical protein